MKVLNSIPTTTYPQSNKQTASPKKQFEQMWENAISSKEFVQKAHKHIENLYAIREKQQVSDLLH